MPLYEFYCNDCQKPYEDFAQFDTSGKYTSIKCPLCGSKKKTKKMSKFGMRSSTPQTSSKWDSFTYRAGHNMERAQGERRAAESASHMGSSSEIYKNMNDENILGEGLHE